MVFLNYDSSLFIENIVIVAICLFLPNSYDSVSKVSSYSNSIFCVLTFGFFSSVRFVYSKVGKLNCRAAKIMIMKKLGF